MSLDQRNYPSRKQDQLEQFESIGNRFGMNLVHPLFRMWTRHEKGLMFETSYLNKTFAGLADGRVKRQEIGSWSFMRQLWLRSLQHAMQFGKPIRIQLPTLPLDGAMTASRIEHDKLEMLALAPLENLHNIDTPTIDYLLGQVFECRGAAPTAAKLAEARHCLGLDAAKAAEVYRAAQHLLSKALPV